jgi:hypothetical protein
VPEPRLHLDADTSTRPLHRTLLEGGHDVTRTPIDWIAQDASDEAQLLAATAHGRVIFTFNVLDFSALALRHPQHGGILLAAQRQWTLTFLIAALDRPLGHVGAAEWRGQVRWLARWRPMACG